MLLNKYGKFQDSADLSNDDSYATKIIALVVLFGKGKLES